ncbi:MULTISPECIES: hypothetical protein [Mycobacteriaceae]|uniref:Uncharacterized protein n=2 Tax=Mycobacteriaceae TaxID=1762 RepID=A0A1Q9W8M9_9MYCO|nr:MULTISPECIES: hypothetical protein [Mycobacteriaceae]MBP2451910.1 hypothetical protein [Mycolicibacterium lutetiense]OHT97151.1 hypothetical protein BKG61_18035 [Mycobacterium syngnathidarum]OLT94396.1 hypothetical protein BKG60_19155 [Mycobacterium syngnathidarum]
MSDFVSDGIEQPIDFSYDACWFECAQCGDRVVMTFEDRDRGQSRTCSSGHDVSARTEYPALTDLADAATDPDVIERLAWYHSSTRADWPPTDESPSASATHLGTFESAIENMFRRMQNQSDADSQFYLHRVRISCPLAEMSPLGEEPTDFMGNVWLSALYEAGYRVVRYVNVHEHPGSISLAVVPSVITHVQTLAVPLNLDTEESAASREIFASYTAELDEVEARRPSTEGLRRMDLLMRRTPEIAAIADADHECDQAMWATEDRYKRAMTNEHVPLAGYRTRSKLLDARRYSRSDRVAAHHMFRLLAELVQNPARTLAALQAQPVREVIPDP